MTEDKYNTVVHESKGIYVDSSEQIVIECVIIGKGSKPKTTLTWYNKRYLALGINWMAKGVTIELEDLRDAVELALKIKKDLGEGKYDDISKNVEIIGKRSSASIAIPVIRGWFTKRKYPNWVGVSAGNALVANGRIDGVIDKINERITQAETVEQIARERMDKIG